MAVRQYIGARYVPEFYYGNNGSAEWVAGVSYEALTIVTRLGNSFTSRKPVPSNIGAPENNPEYWVATGNFNSQLEYVSEELEYRTTKKYIIIGASINLSSGGTIQGGFAQRAIDVLGIPSEDYFNSAVSGSGFTAGSTKFIDQLTNIIASATPEFKAANVRIIVIGGMNNDANASAADYLSAVDSFVALAKENFPKSTIEFVPLSWNLVYSNRLKLNILFTQAISKMPLHGVSIWDNCFGIMHNYVDWFRDNLHFSSAGEDIAESIFINIMNNNFSDSDMVSGGLTELLTPTNVNESLTSMAFGEIREYYDGRIISVNGENPYFIKGGASDLAVSITENSPTILCDNPFHYVRATPRSVVKVFGNINGTIRDNSGNVATAVFFINADNKLCMFTRSNFTIPANTYVNVNFSNAMVAKRYC